MKEKLLKEIKELEELYDYYLEKTEDPYYNYQQKYFEERLHDLRVEIKTYKKVIDMIGDEEKCI